jgi:dipeptidyl aminopeptidase/acylaminoacyl peptidase
MNADGSEQTNISNNPAFDGYPHWSPDGKKIAFMTSRDGINYEIYVMNADGTSQTRLTNNADLDAEPSWSPDGTKIAFRSDRDNHNYQIYVMNADGSEQTNISNNTATDIHPDWSPDGTKIAFASDRAGSYQIYVMNADGSEQTRLTNPAFGYQPSWSPDGTEIAFSSSRDGNSEIYVMNADGSEQTRLTNNADIDEQPSWSPDGTEIAFISSRDYQVYVMNADGSEQTNISNNPAVHDNPDWGPATATEPEDTTPPVITVPEDIAEEATSPDGTEVSFEEEVSAEDDVDGAVDVSCDYNSGDTFPIGETVVTCTAEDAADSAAEESFAVTVQDTTAPDVEIIEAVDSRRSTEIPDGGTTPIPYIRITFEATDTVGIDETECSLDGQQTFIPCTSPASYDRLSRGTHEFTVRVTDEAGNTGEDEFTWTVGNNPSAAEGGEDKELDQRIAEMESFD